MGQWLGIVVGVMLGTNIGAVDDFTDGCFDWELFRAVEGGFVACLVVLDVTDGKDVGSDDGTWDGS